MESGWRSVNPIVGECNDSALNEITERVIEKEHVFAAIESASADFMLGDVGAGKGTTCFGLKGGIGSASRVLWSGRRRIRWECWYRATSARWKICVWMESPLEGS